jgi:hypothetical protein
MRPPRATPLFVAASCLAYQVTFAQSSHVLTLEQGDRRFQFDGAIECIDSPQDWDLIAPRFLVLRNEAGVFVNELRQSCSTLGGYGRFTDIFGESIRGEQLCSGDRFTVSPVGVEVSFGCSSDPFGRCHLISGRVS